MAVEERLNRLEDRVKRLEQAIAAVEHTLDVFTDRPDVHPDVYALAYSVYTALPDALLLGVEVPK